MRYGAGGSLEDPRGGGFRSWASKKRHLNGEFRTFSRSEEMKKRGNWKFTKSLFHSRICFIFILEVDNRRNIANPHFNKSNGISKARSELACEDTKTEPN